MQSLRPYLFDLTKNTSYWLHETKKGLFSRAFFSTQNIEHDAFLKDQVEQTTNSLVTASFSQIERYDRTQFKNMSCIISLSMGQTTHYGPYLAATLGLVNKSFGACTFLLGDTLQRHTEAIKKPATNPDSLLGETEEKGNAWMRENIHLLSKLKIPWNIRRWNHWLEHRRFSELLKRIQHTYTYDQPYKRAIEENIIEYINRLKKRNELIVDEKEAYKHCLNYLQEECAAMCLWIDEKCEFELYANGRSTAMQATYERFIETLHPDLLQPISLRFKKKINNENKANHRMPKDNGNNETTRNFTR